MSAFFDIAKPRVLIVDDDTVEVAEMVAALSDFEVVCARDGGSALELALDQSFELIIAGAALPGIGGMDLLTWLKSESRTQDLPVILVAAEDARTDEVEARGLRMGAVDFITKPIRPAILNARVHTHVELKRQRDLLREYLPHDALTGIASRRRFNQELVRTWARAMRQSRPLTIMLLQLDHFDRYADHYGRSPADECLIRVARSLHRCFCEGEDLAARHSEDRFSVLVDGPDGEAAVREALSAIAALEIPHVRSESSVFVTISIGAVTLDAGPDSTPEDGVAQAQTQLRLAAKRGGNRGELRDLLAGQSRTILLEQAEMRLQKDE